MSRVAPPLYPPMTLACTLPTGNAGFDERFVVSAQPTPGTSPAAVLTPEVQQRMLAHDDWVFWGERYLLGCISPGVFRSAADVGQRIGEVLGVVAALPASAVPGPVDHTGDELAARIAGLTSIEDAMVLLQQMFMRVKDNQRRR